MSERSLQSVEGWLRKKKSHKPISILSNYVKRWFILDTKKEIFGYSNKRTSVPKVAHYIEDITKFEPPSDGYGEFVVHTKTKTYHLVELEKEDRFNWINAFESLMNARSNQATKSSHTKPKKNKKIKRRCETEENNFSKLDLDAVCKQKGPMETVILDQPSPYQVQPVQCSVPLNNIEITNSNSLKRNRRLKRFKTDRRGMIKPHQDQDTCGTGSSNSWIIDHTSTSPVEPDSREKTVVQEIKETSFEHDWDKNEDYSLIAKIANQAQGIQLDLDRSEISAAPLYANSSVGSKVKSKTKRSKTSNRRARRSNKVLNVDKKPIAVW